VAGHTRSDTALVIKGFPFLPRLSSKCSQLSSAILSPNSETFAGCGFTFTTRGCLLGLPRFFFFGGIHRTIILEEPSSALFPEMLDGHIPVEDYLLETDSQFPQFDRLMCDLIREMHQKGKQIIQVEPYLERLIRIHELFAAGKTKEDVRGTSALKEVYEAESIANGALITFYSTSMRAPFAEVVQAVKAFAQTDASRLRLRENLRARAIASIAKSPDSIFIEAGYIHYPLYRYLQRELEAYRKVKVIYLMEEAARRLGGKRRNMGPGDILTLHYALGHNPPKNLADLLAARSLI
jgi:hypothetical protein